MRGPEEEQGGVPEGPGRPLAVASALILGAALAAAAGRPSPMPPVLERGREDGEEGEMDAEIEVGPPPGTRVLAAVAAGLRSGDPFERRETAGVVERLAREGDVATRWALAAALAAMGGREVRLPLALLAADPDRRVRVEARRGLLEEEQPLGGPARTR